MDKHKLGLYGKYFVRRLDGTSEPGRKHDGCSYFVLDLTHDPHAIPAIVAYAKSCEAEYPALAADLRIIAQGGPAIPLPYGAGLPGKVKHADG